MPKKARGADQVSSSVIPNTEPTRDKKIYSGEKRSLNIIPQLDIKPLSQEQLIVKVKSIYAELILAEAKCVSFHSKPDSVIRILTHQPNPQSPRDLNHEGLQKLIALHRRLLFQYHDFFLATQHPSARLSIRQLATKYAMPARLWRHGIHSFLEVLRNLLPTSLDYMLAFIYLSYSTIALLFETVSVFEDTWIECLGDLSRYRMAIEDDNSRDRDIWTNVAREWYTKASNNEPAVGRLYHHMAILARPNVAGQLFYYAKSLCTLNPFTSARESILTLFEPNVEENDVPDEDKQLTLDYLFVKVQGIIFTSHNKESFDETVQIIATQIQNGLRVPRRFRHISYCIGIINCVAILEYGSKDNCIMKVLLKSEVLPMDAERFTIESSGDKDTFKRALHLSYSFLESLIQKNCLLEGDVLPYLHVTLTFMYYLARNYGALCYIKAGIPRNSLITKLNNLLKSDCDHSRIESFDFPSPENGDNRPLPEDYAMRGFFWANDYFPRNWFTNEKIEEQEKYLEHSALDNKRKERILWLAYQIAHLDSELFYFGGNFFASHS